MYYYSTSPYLMHKMVATNVGGGRVDSRTGGTEWSKPTKYKDKIWNQATGRYTYVYDDRTKKLNDMRSAVNNFRRSERTANRVDANTRDIDSRVPSRNMVARKMIGDTRANRIDQQMNDPMNSNYRRNAAGRREARIDAEDFGGGQATSRQELAFKTASKKVQNFVNQTVSAMKQGCADLIGRGKSIINDIIAGAKDGYAAGRSGKNFLLSFDPNPKSASYKLGASVGINAGYDVYAVNTAIQMAGTSFSKAKTWLKKVLNGNATSASEMRERRLNEDVSGGGVGNSAVGRKYAANANRIDTSEKRSRRTLDDTYGYGYNNLPRNDVSELREKNRGR